MTCTISHCGWVAFRWGLCVPHALTWALTPGFRLPAGPLRDEAMRRYVARTEARKLAKEARLSQDVDTEEGT